MGLKARSHLIPSVDDLPRCHRCGGRMVSEWFYGDEGPFHGWRCIACGEIIDEVILENRRGGPWKSKKHR